MPKKEWTTETDDIARKLLALLVIRKAKQNTKIRIARKGK